jgi:hypothetical protein
VTADTPEGNVTANTCQSCYTDKPTENATTGKQTTLQPLLYRRSPGSELLLLVIVHPLLLS